MKKLKIILIAILLSFGCSTDINEAGIPEPFTIENTDYRFYDDGSGMTSTQKAKKAEAERRGKPTTKVAKRTINLKPQPRSTARLVNPNETGNIMLDPKEYLGILPTDDNGGLVDWDGDGEIDDLIVINNRCYFARTFSSVSVFLNGTDEKIINYTIAYGARLLGFVDYDNDGDQDIIFEGGNHYEYNGSTYGQYTHSESYSQFNVGENVLDQYPLTTKEIIQSLVITATDPNPEAITWDLSEYGYSAYAFHVYLFNKVTLDYEQTTTYGEWGFYTLNRLVAGETYILRFTNLDDGCKSIDVEFLFDPQL